MSHRIDPFPVPLGYGMSPAFACAVCHRDLEVTPTGYRHAAGDELWQRFERQSERVRRRRYARAILTEALIDTVGSFAMVDDALVSALEESLVLHGVSLDELDELLGDAVSRTVPRDPEPARPRFRVTDRLDPQS